MSFVGLILHNVRARWVRSLLTAIAVAVGVATVVALGVVTHSLRDTAAAVLQTGKADFTVAQTGVSDVLESTINEKQLARIRDQKGVASVVGALIGTTHYNADNPLLIEIGIPPEQLKEFGVRIVDGRAYTHAAPGEILIGWRAADNLNKHVGDPITVDGVHYTVVGIYATGQALGDAGVMIPLIPFQAHQREPGLITLAFVRVDKGTPIKPLREKIHHDQPVLTTVRYESEFGRVDRNLQLLSAADSGATLLALIIGAVIVANTMMLSFFERTREFGLMRAVGWARTRIMLLVVGEALIISLIGAAVGIGIAYGVTQGLEHLPALRGIFHPTYSSYMFWRALYIAAGIGLLGAIYPAARAAFLRPLAALRRE